ncbi:uncharacterized protein LOC100374453 [Saccoglossus kowalevskii]|uniref:Uncharacterized protein LOC100374453 n=1 Tax=Saccoglossus kowalevskii TaxID=10224 RepID=A0A0U2USN3_SACKO|nr:PREDICTED: uncharacterized protein LOC100374453 [Saccoglossus kowalevskii]ALR88622.1 von Willebrand type d domain protein-like m15 [Saccoglossus kowalevskii]
MAKIAIFLSICVIIASLCNDVHGKSVKKRAEAEAEVTGTDSGITLMSLEEAVENYNLGGTELSKRQLPGIHPDAVVLYALMPTCTNILLWIFDFTKDFYGGVMQIKYSTDLANMPPTWTDINQFPVDYFGSPSWITNIGPFKPCTTVHISVQLEKNGDTAYLGNFSTSTDCPCDCTSCIGEPHYTTFENIRFDFNGPCSYILTDTCLQASHSLKMIVKHVFVKANVESIESATVIADGHTLDLLDDGSIQVDGVLVSDTTFITNDGNVQVQVLSQYVKAIFSVTAKWWILWIKNSQTKRNEIRFEIKDNSVLVEKQCGMLGPKYLDKTQHPFLGFIMPNGAITNDATEHGNSWVVLGSCP